MTTFWTVIIAVFLDFAIGDPHGWPHPIKLIGALIGHLTKWLNRPDYSSRQRYWLGVLTWFVTVGLAGGITWLLLAVTTFNFYLHAAVAIYLAYACLSSRQLAIEAQKIMTSISENNIDRARHQVGMIVGRDTDNLSMEGVTKATIETVAENTSDGEIAPMLCLVIGGPVLAMAYKAINTLDSMIGYRNQQFTDFGRFAAKADDVANYVPARITWLLLLVASWLLRDDVSEAVKVGRRDRKKHLSPNSAFSESVVAGALHLQLGGPHYYFGQMVTKPYIGDDFGVVATSWHLKRTIQMLYLATILGLIGFDGVRLLLIWE